ARSTPGTGERRMSSTATRSASAPASDGARAFLGRRLRRWNENREARGAGLPLECEVTGAPSARRRANPPPPRTLDARRRRVIRWPGRQRTAGGAMSEKTWAGEPFWGLGYDWDPDWF